MRINCLPYTSRLKTNQFKKDMMHRILPYLLTIFLFSIGLSILRGADPASNNVNIETTRKITFAKNNIENSYLPQNQGTPDTTSEAPVTKEESEIRTLAAYIKEQNRYIERIDSSTVMDLPAGI